MPRLNWSPKALSDMQRLYRFLAKKSPEAAKNAVKTIRLAVKVLELQPHIGRPIQNMDVEYREWLVDFGASGYLILYHFDGKEALILAVRHQLEAGYSS